MGTVFRDRWGSPVHAGQAGAVAALDVAVEDLVRLGGEPMAGAQRAAEDPELILAPVLSAYLALYSTGRGGFAQAQALVGDLDPWSLGAGERELLHVLAAQAWAGGELERAAGFLERALLHDQRDLLALKVAQDLYFFTGNQLDLRGVVERVLPAWPARRPGAGYVQGMYAFGLEECGRYAEAADRARLALETDAGDVWAVHALAHVHEMEGRQQAGIDFLTSSTPDWKESYFAVHNWWHLALYHLELGQIDQVLALYDGPVRGARSLEWLDVVDAASLLWRLSLFGVAVRARAERLAEDLATLVDEPAYVFNDWHAVMVAGLVGDLEWCERMTSANRRAATGTNRRAVDTAGLDLLEGFSAWSEGDAARCVRRLADVGPRAPAVGGSHAQRDVIDLTLLAAAARAGQDELVQQLVARRVTRKPSARAAADALVDASRSDG